MGLVTHETEDPTWCGCLGMGLVTHETGDPTWYGCLGMELVAWDWGPYLVWVSGYGTGSMRLGTLPGVGVWVCD